MNRPLLSPGHTACAGCGQSLAARLVVDTCGPNTIVVNNTGCLEVFSTKYPESSWEVPWIHSLFENAAAVASGVEAALKYLGKKDKINVIAQAGDGGTADIGLQALSGMLERGHDILYVCLPPETELILSDGSIIEIGEFVDKVISEKQQDTEKLITFCEKIIHNVSYPSSLNVSPNSNLIVPVEQEQAKEAESVEIAPVRDKAVLSWDRTKFLPMNIICAQRKTSGNNLIKIVTASGRKLSLTPEHLVLIDTIDGPKWQRADLLKIKDEVYAPRRLTLNVEKEFYIVDLLNGNIKVKLTPQWKEKINQELQNIYGDVKRAAIALRFKYWQFKEKKRMVDLEGLKNISKELPTLKWGEIKESLNEFGVQGGKPIKISEKKLKPDLLYILGLISSDGSLNERNYEVTFTNKETSLIEEVKRIYRKLFTGRKISEFKDKQGVIRLTISDPVLSLLAKNLRIKSDPKELIKLREDLIAEFIKGFFDGDGYCGITKTKYSYDAKVILTTIEERLAMRLRQMLQRLGIACFQDNRENRFDLTISSREDIERFLNKISTKHPIQKERMKEIKNLWETRKQRGRYFSIAPKICGKILKDICIAENMAITKLDKKRNICSLAKGARRATKQRFHEYKESLLRLIGKEKQNLFKSLDLYLRDDFYLDPIDKIETISCKSKYVYDITVENTHLFVPEAAFIISNCYDNEAYMNCLSLDSLIMTKEGLRKITEIKVGDEVAAFNQNTYDLVYKKCTGVFDNGIKDVYELKARYHSIKATSNHPFLVLKRNGRGRNNTFAWKTLAQIRLNDEVVTLKRVKEEQTYEFAFQKVQKGDYKVNKINPIEIPEKSSPELMKYLGIYVGDGWIREEKAEAGFALPEDSQERKEFLALHERLFKSKLSLDKMYVYVRSINLARFISSLGFRKGAKNKTIPEWVFTLPKDQREAFIDGLMLSDGYKFNGSWRYVSSSLELLKRLRLLAQITGFRVGKIHWQKVEAGKKCVKRKLLKDTGFGYICMSRRRQPNINKWLSQTRYRNFLADNRYFDVEKVIEIKYVGLEPTLDLRVEDEHDFVADGIVVHNTGVQRSGLTPFNANTTTSPAGAKSSGNIHLKKPMPEIALAHGVPYVATASVAFPQDIQKKVKKALSIKGPKYIQIHVPCPLGWRHQPELTYQVAKLAVETGLYPLFEFESGRLASLRKIQPKPVEEYLKVQGRFKHLLSNPDEIKKIQEIADNNIEKYRLRVENQAVTKESSSP